MLIHAFSTIVFLLAGSGAGLDSAARFYGLAAGNVSAFTLSPGGSQVSALFDNFSVRRSGGKLTTNGVSERRFVLAANKRASGCAAKFTLRGAMLAAEALPTGVIIIRVNGHETTFTPKEISWLVTVDSFLSKREQTEVVIIAKLSSDRMSDNELVEIDSLDIELDKCWRK